jgi:sugar lactone lactonase YvrE
MRCSTARILATRPLTPLLLIALLGACGAPFTREVDAIADASASSGATGGAGGGGAADTVATTASASSSSVSAGSGGSGGTGEPPPDCGGADLQNDGKNCGICAHDCLSAACAKGLCAPTTIASGQGAAVALALDDARVYWADAVGGAVMAALKGGGMLAVIAAGQTSPHRIAAHAGDLLWTNAAPGKMGAWRAATTGVGQAQITSDPTPYGIAADDTGIFWVVQSNPQATLLRAKLDGSAVSILTTKPAGAEEIALDATRVYITSPTDGVITSVKKNGAGMSSLVTSGKPLGLAVDDASVYWTDADAGTVARVDKAGVSVETLATAQDHPTRIALDIDSVYWTDRGDPGCVAASGSVAKRAKAGGPVVVLAQGLRCPEGIAVDGQHVYWTSLGAASIQRVAK